MDGLLASLFSTGDTLKRQLRGLLANPVGEAQQNLLSVGDTSRQHLQDLAASGGLGVLGSDPAYRQSAKNRVQAQTIDAASNVVMPMLTVWQGGPHRFASEVGFPAGRIRLDKIGTGEGAQAYGHGAYLAEAKDVGNEYAQRLWKNVYPASRSEISDAESTFWKEFKNHFSLFGTNAPKEQIAATKSKMDAAELALENAKKLMGPQLYQFDLPDSVLPRLLDWNARVKDHPAEVQAAILPIVKEALRARGTPPNMLDHIAKQKYVEDLVKGDLRMARETFSQRMQEAGIPGLRYLDGNSRGAGQGTRNFVIWDQGLLDQMPPLEINGVPTGLLR